MILELFKNDDIHKQIQKSYLLFPTIERMKISFNGQLYTRLCLPILFLLAYIIKFYEILPSTVKIFFIYIYFWLFSIPNYFIGTTLKYLKWSVIEKVTFLANDEMNRVQELDINIIEKNQELLKLYYSKTDGWVPIKYFKEIKEKLPNLDAKLDDKNIAHAFVLRSSKEMGDLVSEWIIENRYHKG